jgi:flagellar biosynthesis protein FlhF
MRLRTITASDMQDAMRIMREEIGEDAVIISTARHPKGKGVTVTVAQEEEPADLPVEEPAEAAPALGERSSKPAAASSGMRSMPDYIVKDVEQIMQRHGVAGETIDGFLKAVQAQSPLKDDSEESLAALLESSLATAYRFEPINLLTEGYRYILIGPPGAGKTLTTAKMAAQVVKAGHSLVLVNTDNRKAGAVEQLAAYAEVLGVRLEVAESRADLKAILKHCDPTDRVIIDSAGANPYAFHELKELAEFASLIELEPLLIYPAGSDPEEAGEIARAFSFVGVQKMIATRLDVAKRFGSLLTAAHHATLAFSHASASEKVLEKFDAITPQSLARLLMDYRAKRH